MGAAVGVSEFAEFAAEERDASTDAGDEGKGLLREEGMAVEADGGLELLQSPGVAPLEVQVGRRHVENPP